MLWSRCPAFSSTRLLLPSFPLTSVFVSQVDPVCLSRLCVDSIPGLFEGNPLTSRGHLETSWTNRTFAYQHDRSIVRALLLTDARKERPQRIVKYSLQSSHSPLFYLVTICSAFTPTRGFLYLRDPVSHILDLSPRPIRSPAFIPRRSQTFGYCP